MPKDNFSFEKRRKEQEKKAKKEEKKNGSWRVVTNRQMKPPQLSRVAKHLRSEA